MVGRADSAVRAAAGMVGRVDSEVQAAADMAGRADSVVRAAADMAGRIGSADKSDLAEAEGSVERVGFEDMVRFAGMAGSVDPAEIQAA